MDTSNRRGSWGNLVKGVPERHFIILEAFLMVLLMAYLVFLIFWTVNGVVDSLPAGQQVEIEPVIDQILHLLLTRITVLFVLVSLFNFLIGLFYLNRITGPLVRIKGVLDRVAEGEVPSHDTTLRKKDYHKDLAHALNNALKKVREWRK
jgi:hypothetical protein